MKRNSKTFRNDLMNIVRTWQGKIILLIMGGILLYAPRINAQEPETKAAYQYRHIACWDKDGNVVDTIDCFGIILVAEAQGQECICVTIGEEELYNGLVQRKKTEYSDNKKTIVYLVIQEFHGAKVPLQIFEIYDLTKSSHIPDSFMVSICSTTTGEVVRSQSFHSILRMR